MTGGDGADWGAWGPIKARWPWEGSVGVAGSEGRYKLSSGMSDGELSNKQRGQQAELRRGSLLAGAQGRIVKESGCCKNSARLALMTAFADKRKSTMDSGAAYKKILGRLCASTCCSHANKAPKVLGASWPAPHQASNARGRCSSPRCLSNPHSRWPAAPLNSLSVDTHATHKKGALTWDFTPEER
jgi:hypothetical protein